MKRKKRRCVWLIEPTHPNTNSYIAGRLAERKYANERHGVKCPDGVARDFWEIPNFHFISLLIQAGKIIPLPFNLWRKIGSGLPKPWLF